MRVSKSFCRWNWSGSSPNDKGGRLTELQTVTTWKALPKGEIYKSVTGTYVPKSLSVITVSVKSMLRACGSTYICEETFSFMIFVRSEFCSRLTEDHSQGKLRISHSRFKANIRKLVRQNQHRIPLKNVI